MGLVMWECLGATHVDPKATLRKLSLPELSSLIANIETELDDVERFAVVQMIRVERMYRQGLTEGDWTFTRNGNGHVNVRYSMQSEKLTKSFHSMQPTGWASA